MATFKWATPDTIATALSTELNALANAGFSAASAAIDNETGLFRFIDLEIVIAAQGAARSAGAIIEIYLEKSIDGTNFDDRALTDFVSNFLCSFQLDAAVTARRLSLANIEIPPLQFKLTARNNTGQALAASGSTLRYRRHNDQSV